MIVVAWERLVAFRLNDAALSVVFCSKLLTELMFEQALVDVPWPPEYEFLSITRNRC